PERLPAWRRQRCQFPPVRTHCTRGSRSPSTSSGDWARQRRFLTIAAANSGPGEACYTGCMTKTAKQLLERIASWPEEDIEKLVEAARQIEAWRNGEYHATKHGLHAIGEAIAQLNRSEEHTSELQSQSNLVCRLLLE